MMLLTQTSQAIARASRLLELSGPGPRPAWGHWQEARMHLAAAARELERLIELHAAAASAPVGRSDRAAPATGSAT